MFIYLLQAGSGSSGGGMFGGGTGTLFFMGAIILVFWLFFIRPQTKKQKEQKKFIEDLQRGTKVVTIAGIHGTVNKVNEDGTINLEVSPGSYIKMEKASISLEMTAALNKAAVTTEKK
ncbi:MAG TPA: preprotein translocase subunit YajC [Chitinophagaceae bacterium]|jgi:preprotein translocase subunit YajC